MVSNFERILAEIGKDAARVAPAYRLDPDTIVNLVMEIVDLEDQHRLRAQPRINQKVRQMIERVAPVHAEGG